MLELAKKYCANYFDNLNGIENYCCLELYCGTTCVFARDQDARCIWYDKCILPLVIRLVKCPRCKAMHEPDELCPKCHRHKRRRRKHEQSMGKEMEGARRHGKNRKTLLVQSFDRRDNETTKRTRTRKTKRTGKKKGKAKERFS